MRPLDITCSVVCLCVCVSVCLSVSLFVCLLVCLSMRGLSVCLSVCMLVRRMRCAENCWTNRDAVWTADSCVLKNHVLHGKDFWCSWTSTGGLGAPMPVTPGPLDLCCWLWLHHLTMLTKVSCFLLLARHVSFFVHLYGQIDYRQYSLAPAHDLITYWRSKVKVTAGCQGGKSIHVGVHLLFSFKCRHLWDRQAHRHTDHATCNSCSSRLNLCTAWPCVGTGAVS